MVWCGEPCKQDRTDRFKGRRGLAGADGRDQMGGRLAGQTEGTKRFGISQTQVDGSKGLSTLQEKYS